MILEAVLKRVIADIPDQVSLSSAFQLVRDFIDLD
jgi:hypothetical protein